MVRVETGDGRTMDVPISGIKLHRIMRSTGMLTLSINS